MKIEHIAMNVREPAALAQWYAANLGLRIIRADTSGTFIHFLADDDGETLLEFYANDSGEYPQLGHWSFHIAFNSDDLAASRAETLSVFLRWSTRAIVAIALVLILMALTLL